MDTPTPLPTPEPSQSVSSSPSVMDSLNPSEVVDDIGNTFCACQPSAFSLKLDFSNSCATNTSPVGDTEQDSCIDPEAPFASVTRVAFLEYSGEYDFIPRSKTERVGTFVDGDVVSFESVTNGPLSGLDELVGNWELYVAGLDANGNRVNSQYHFRFNLLSCSNYPVMYGGESWGVSTFVSAQLAFSSANYLHSCE